MLAAIHQLHYLPWLRYMEKLARADVFIVLDDVQYTKNGFQNRNKIKHAGGWMYLTVPVRASFGQTIREVAVAGNTWGPAHWRAIETNYRKAPHYLAHAAPLADICRRSWERLAEVSWELLAYFRHALEIPTPVVRASELGVMSTSTTRLIELCQAVGADRYYSGSHAAEAYLDQRAMEEAGIGVVLQEWVCPTYHQCFPEVGFLPDLSVLDLLLNEGPHARQVLLHGQQEAVAL